jgi:hypothetical protein
MLVAFGLLMLPLRLLPFALLTLLACRRPFDRKEGRERERKKGAGRLFRQGEQLTTEGWEAIPPWSRRRRKMEVLLCRLSDTDPDETV